jgi:hypothetical protein
MMPVEPSDRCFIEKEWRALDLAMKDDASALDFGKFRVIIFSNAKSHPASTPTTEPRAAGAVPGLP